MRPAASSVGCVTHATCLTLVGLGMAVVVLLLIAGVLAH